MQWSWSVTLGQFFSGICPPDASRTGPRQDTAAPKVMLGCLPCLRPARPADICRGNTYFSLWHRLSTLKAPCRRRVDAGYHRGCAFFHLQPSLFLHESTHCPTFPCLVCFLSVLDAKIFHRTHSAHLGAHGPSTSLHLHLQPLLFCL